MPVLGPAPPGTVAGSESARAPALVDALLHQGVIVRSMAGFWSAQCLPGDVGPWEQNERFLAAMRTVLAEVPVAQA